MKSHDVARVLRQLADLLSSGPNMELKETSIVSADSASTNKPNMALNLSTLVELSRLDKQQWLEFISENHFPIETRPRDASRDILGKLLTYLEQNPEARKRLKEIANKKTGQASPELIKALSFLLKDNHEQSTE